MFNFFRHFMFGLTLISILTSCSSIEFTSSGRETYFVAAKVGSERGVDVEVTRGFYFWGLSPNKAVFNLSEEFKGLGVSNPSYVAITQKYTLSDVLLTLLSLGLYSPVTYEVTLLSKGETK